MHSELLTSDNSVLVIVDIQSKLLAAMKDQAAQTLLTYVGILSEAAGVLNIPVLLTEQYPKGLGATDPAVVTKLPKTFQIFDKTGFSCCAVADFNEALTLSRRKQVLLTGMEAHICVLQTALDLTHQGYQVFAVEDALCSRRNEHKFYALQRMQQHGVNITNHESVLFEWLRDAVHPEFKRLSALLPKEG